MSSGTGYNYSYVDQEAERRRALRAELVALAERTKGFNAQAKAVQRAYRTQRIRLNAVSVPASAESDRLIALADAARAELARAEAELSRRIAESWAAADTVAERPQVTAASRADAARERTGQAQSAPAPADRTPQVRSQAVAAAEEMLQRDSPACDPGDLDRFAQQLGFLRRARTVDDVRRVSTDLAASVTRSVVRRSQAERIGVTRQLLLDRLDGAEAAADAAGAALRARVADAPDPSWLEQEVAQAVARADRLRSRIPVARAVRAALQAMDYEVGEEFEDLLAGSGEVIVPFGAEERPDDRAQVPVDGYGLRVTLSADRARLTTAVVRQESAATPEQAGSSDLQVQRWFCDGQSQAIENSVLAGGVALQRTSVLAPGMMPAAAVDDEHWPARNRRRPGRRQSAVTRQVRNEERQRER